MSGASGWPESTVHGEFATCASLMRSASHRKIAPSLQFKHNMKSQYQWWDTAHAKVHSMAGARTAMTMKDTLLMLAPVFLTGFDLAE